MASQVKIEVDGLKEARAAVRKAGGSLEDLEKVNRDAAELIQADAVRRAPRRSGRLRAAIEVQASATTGKVIGSGQLVYLPVVHFGWVTRNATRGLSRRQAQETLGEALTRRSINKSFRASQDRTIFHRDRTTGYREVVGRKRGVRGGPIKPRPFLYEAADARVDEVFLRYEKQADEIEKALSWQRGVF